MFSFSSAAVIALTGLISFSSSAPTPVRPSDFERMPGSDFDSVRSLSHIEFDRSGRGGDPVDKYYHESTFHPHYDGRFSTEPLKDHQQHEHLSVMMSSYLATMQRIDAETWIMHGSLLGWWWNKEIMPWDSDVDVMMSEAGMRQLAEFNMTVHVFEYFGSAHPKKYLIDVNPHWQNSSTADRLNAIDARWIDTDTGLFIDITTLRPDTEDQSGLGWMVCKDRHSYLADDIFPLRETTFEDTPVKVPYAYSKLLEEEYSSAALTNTRFNKHTFDQYVMAWIPDQSS